jgi:hypothetical protein
LYLVSVIPEASANKKQPAIVGGINVIAAKNRSLKTQQNAQLNSSLKANTIGHELEMLANESAFFFHPRPGLVFFV